MCFFSATLHSPQITELAKQICTNPTWVDLKGHDSVPDTVHHVLYRVDPERDLHYCVSSPHPACTDNMHSLAGKKRSSSAVLRTPEERSQAVKEIKQHVLLKLIDAYEVCCLFIFCRRAHLALMQMLSTYKSPSIQFSSINFLTVLLIVAQMSQCIVFCRTNLDCTNLEDFLCAYSGVEKFRGKRESGKEGKYSCCVMAGNYDVKLYVFLLYNAYIEVLSCLRHLDETLVDCFYRVVSFLFRICS